ncbi:hypothetical protein [Polyangium sp. 15x6]|uniref:hypothetical protein n=1 Tax=Polyangium sp. 15x6 TaxID=3042687 RepID=UPI002499D38A|nr:hypothetical protein [Polyangium sp. 15x6]MDI3282422.1 hypothetical protein [Polyangium sp. 15x6]
MPISRGNRLSTELPMRRFLAPSLAALAALFTLSTAQDAEAQAYRDGPPPQHRIVYNDLTLFRWNPLGLITDARFVYRYRLYKSESAALRDNFIGIGLAPSLSGAFARGGPTIQIQPASFLQLWALYEGIGYFGAFNFLQSYPTADATKVNYSDTELARRGDLEKGNPEKNYSTTGTQLIAGANLQFKFGPIAARNLFRFGRPDMKLRQGDRVFYDIFYDLLVGDGGLWYSNDADLLYQGLDNRLTVGLRWTTGQAFYNDEHFGPGDDKTRAPGAIHRIGPIAAWTFKKPDGAALEPTILLVANWWLKSPYRTGQDVSQAVPYIILALNITGDLLPAPAPEKPKDEPEATKPPPSEPPAAPAPTPEPAKEPAPAAPAEPAPAAPDAAGPQ